MPITVQTKSRTSRRERWEMRDTWIHAWTDREMIDRYRGLGKACWGVLPARLSQSLMLKHKESWVGWNLWAQSGNPTIMSWNPASMRPSPRTMNCIQFPCHFLGSFWRSWTACFWSGSHWKLGEIQGQGRENCRLTGSASALCQCSESTDQQQDLCATEHCYSSFRHFLDKIIKFQSQLHVVSWILVSYDKYWLLSLCHVLHLYLKISIIF